MDYVKAFVVGGLICAAAQILLEKTKMMPGRVMVLLVCTGVVPERQCPWRGLEICSGRA